MINFDRIFRISRIWREVHVDCIQTVEGILRELPRPRYMINSPMNHGLRLLREPTDHEPDAAQR
jgi:hypothetical protein